MSIRKIGALGTLLTTAAVRLFAQGTAPADSASQAASAAADAAKAAAAAASAAPSNSVWKYFAAAIAVGLSCLAGGYAVAAIGAAAMGAMSENPELSGKALPYAGLAEGICLWGFLVALFILLI